MTRKGSVNKFYDNFHNYIFSSEQVYFSELHDAQICEMEEQTTAYSTQTALCMHRGWVGITSASTGLPWYLQFSTLHLYTHEWEGFDWENVLSILQIPQGVNSTGNIIFAYMTELEPLYWNMDFLEVIIPPVDFQALLHHSVLEQPRNPFVLPLPLLFPPKPDEWYCSF